MRSIRVSIPDSKSVNRSILKWGAVLGCAYIVYAVRPIWLPLGLAFALAMVLDPIVDRMELRGWSRARASAFIFISFLLIVIGLTVLAIPFVVDQIATLQSGFERYFPDSTHAGLAHSFRRLGASDSVTHAGVAIVENLRGSIERSSTWVSVYGMSLIANAAWVMVVPFVAFYALRDFHTILVKALLIVPARHRELVKSSVTEVTEVFAKYIRGLALASLLNGVATVLLLTVLHVPGSLLVGVVAGLFYSVPYVGAIFTILLTAAVAFVGGGPSLMLIAVGLSLLLHQVVFDQIVTPRIHGSHVGLHPIISIVALLIGNLLLGVIGMIVAIPVAACIQLVVLAVVPKLSHEFEIAAPSGEHVESKSGETEGPPNSHPHLDATEERHSAVTAAVDFIEQDLVAVVVAEVETLIADASPVAPPAKPQESKTPPR